jgi:hypothetical protein
MAKIDKPLPAPVPPAPPIKDVKDKVVKNEELKQAVVEVSNKTTAAVKK